ncbi:glycosyltransferase [Myxacorys almedinensis]|uniref:Glycosyltransferase n=1 Tax=Myxacorys almedinensis A TaxID=2690445 RepID=A0A8J8CJR7_9CYAN|nr:glycosyltransferase [Myxacorys almedinensis]NDJ17886.1 glycosyltransferase [Myxacorys almedinensis A]
MTRLLIATTVVAALRAFFVPMAHHFRAMGWQVDGMAQGASGCPQCNAAFDHVWEIDWSRNPLAAQNLVAVPQQLRKVVTKQAYDLVHVSTPVAAFVARYALNGLRQQGKLKIIYTAQGFHFYQGGSPWKNAAFLTLEKLAGRWTDYLVVVNHEDEEAAKHYSLVPPPQVRYIPGTGLNLERFHPDAVPESEVVRVRQALGLSAETPLFLSVAELIPRKRPCDILQAFAALQPSTAHLAFAGAGVLLEEMQQFAIHLGVQDRVHFLGLRSDIPTLMRSAIATILASEQEGLPNCVMESLCLGVPVIGSQIRGTQDLLDGGYGFLFPVGSVAKLTEAMTLALEQPEATQLIGKRSWNRMAPYGLHPVLKQYEALYTEALNSVRANEILLPV